MLRHLDLFSGIGGWTLGFHETGRIETVGFCEIEKYPQKILKKHFPTIPIFQDIRELDYEQLQAEGLISDTKKIDILTCSYPCQPFSVAGKKRGEKDERHLWPEVARLIKDDRIRPRYVIGENVGGHIRLGLDTVSEDMERCGYRWRCFSVEAACIGANHRRQRVWWIAEDTHHDSNSNSKRPHRKKINKFRSNESNDRQECDFGSVREVLANKRDTEVGETADVADTNYEGLRPWQRRSISESLQENDGRRDNKRRTGNNDGDQVGESSFLRKDAEDVADTNSKRRRGRKTRGQNAEDVRQSSRRAFTRNWDVEPNVGRVANGVSNRVDRLKGLGNAIVPQMAYYIGKTILEYEDFIN